MSPLSYHSKETTLKSKQQIQKWMFLILSGKLLMSFQNEFPNLKLNVSDKLYQNIIRD